MLATGGVSEPSDFTSGLISPLLELVTSKVSGEAAECSKIRFLAREMFVHKLLRGHEDGDLYVSRSWLR